MRQNIIHDFTWADQDWIGLMIFKTSGLDRIQFCRIRTGLGLKNFTVRSSLVPEEPWAFSGTYRCHDYIQSQMSLNPCEELIQIQPIRSVNTNNVGNRLCLQRLVSVVKFIAERRLAFRDDENVGTPRKFFRKNFKTFLKQILKKRRCDASSDGFCNSFTNR